MSDSPKTKSAEHSRRSMLRRLAYGAGGAAMLATTMSGNRMASAQTKKVSQKLVGYQDTPHGAQRCDNCAQFESPSSCKVVDGAIVPQGWCKVYVKKPA